MVRWGITILDGKVAFLNTHDGRNEMSWWMNKNMLHSPLAFFFGGGAIIQVGYLEICSGCVWVFVHRPREQAV